MAEPMPVCHLAPALYSRPAELPQGPDAAAKPLHDRNKHRDCIVCNSFIEKSLP
ncbi:MAG TPA: hypothetical protein QF469_04125 [Sphingomonas sanguinis]|uniref:hypothetical protein n=1 Tax=Sphingomonas sanguinis TaxID=33051 RepID=UPI002AC09A33|nr:hypothetical protein [Sphingomonas sanguinis]